MDNELTEEQKAALERFKRTKDNPETLAGFFYGLLGEADPRFTEYMERQAAIVMHAGHKLGSELKSANIDPDKRADLTKKLREIATKINSSVYEPDVDDKIKKGTEEE